MQIDPIQEWQRLTDHYRRMSDAELQELAYSFADLTPTAQQTLGGEMRSRGLGDPQDASRVRTAATFDTKAALPPNRGVTLNRTALGIGPQQDELEAIPDEDATEEQEDGTHHFTWKTPLCDCETREQAWQMQEVLRRAGIESWVQRSADGGIRVYVAADELDRAQAIAAQPIPQEIVEESHTPLPEYEAPVCPKCGAEDPLLESVDPTNSWYCEACGAEWTDAAPAQNESAQSAEGK
jgi:hypothetical protein